MCSPAKLCAQASNVRHVVLQTRQSAQQRLPTGPGYSCPQQVRQWLQLQNSEPDEVVCATTEQQGPANATGRNAAAGEGEPQAKRQKPGRDLNVRCLSVV